MMFKRVRNTVAAATSGKQTTWEHTSLSGEFYFNLGLGKLLDEYDGTALADDLFVIDQTKTSDRIIAGLKSHNWYKQNPAVDLLDATSVSEMTNDSLFVIGRNIYQAACGSSSRAISFIEHFVSHTREYGPKKRKALLDGMLFEIFFSPKGVRRRSIKAECFNEVFELLRHAELAASFDFIAAALLAAGGDFHAIPGKGHDLAVTVSAKTRDDKLVVEAIYIGGINVLRADADGWNSAATTGYFTCTSARHLNDQLSLELAVPARLLTLTYVPPSAGNASELWLPIGWTVRKT